MDWLVFDNGTPYPVSVFTHDAELAEQLQCYYEDEAASWSVCVVFDAISKRPEGIILCMVAEDITERGPFLYSKLEVLIGPVEALTIAQIKKPGWRLLLQWLMAATSIQQLKYGQMGNYHLCDQPGQLKTNDALNLELLLKSEARVNEKRPFYNSGLTDVERELITHYRVLNRQDKYRMVQIASILATDDPAVATSDHSSQTANTG